jgi:diguanylate cyclase (GGDEF)-like protein
MRISTITNWAYGITLLLTGLSGGAFILSEAADVEERAAVEQHLALDDESDTLAMDAERRTDEARLFVMRAAPRHLAAFQRETRDIRSLEQTIARLRAGPITPAERAALDAAESHIDELDAIETGAIAAFQHGDAAGAQQMLFGPDHERAQLAVLEPVNRFRDLVAARTENAMGQAQARSDWLSEAAKLLLAITALLFLGVLYFILRRRVAVPLGHMTRIVKRLAGQDYAVEVPVDRRRDEIGEMHQAIEVFRENGLERDRLDAEQAADRRTKDAILQMMHRLQACATQNELAEVVITFAPQIFPGHAGHLYVLNEGRTTLSLAGSWLDPRHSAISFAPTACWALRRGRPHHSNHDHSDIACLHIDEATDSSLCMPLTAQGDAVGLLYFERREGLPETASPRLYLELVAENIGLALANLRLRKRLTQLAVRDPLTSLLNRRCLDETLNRRARDAIAEPVTCLMIDIDHFKRFNDEFGHDAGDAVLQHVAQMMVDGFDGEASTFRFGGEEFTVLLPGCDEAAGASIADQVRGRIATAALSHRGRVLPNVSISVGVADAPTGGPVTNLLSRADAALLRAKELGRNQVVCASHPPALPPRKSAAA